MAREGAAPARARGTVAARCAALLVVCALVAAAAGGDATAATPPETTAPVVETTAVPTTTVPTTTVPGTTTPPTTTTRPTTTTTIRPRPKDPIKDSPIVKWPGAGQVALSFDDGPATRYTTQALQILARERVPATFFVNCTRFAQHDGAAVVLQASRAGHSIQNHTWSHPFLGSTDTPGVVSELLSCSRAIHGLVGKWPTVFRPPYGSTSPRVERIAGWLGMTKVMWNVCPSRMIFTTTSVVSGLERQIRAKAADHRQGIVILLHDGSGSAGATMAALPEIIRYLKSLGYRFVRLG